MMNKIIDFIKSERGKTFIAALAAVIMYFTPAPVDEFITALLAVFGISVLAITDKKET